MIIVDTSVWIDYLARESNAHTDWLDSRVGSISLGLTDLILCEVLQGIRHNSNFVRVQRQLSQLDLFETCGKELAVASAANYRKLRARGHTIRTTVDCLIATLCLQNGFQLLHHDRDFDVFEQHLGLHVVHPKVQ